MTKITKSYSSFQIGGGKTWYADFDQNHYYEIAMGRLTLEQWARIESLIKEVENE